MYLSLIPENLREQAVRALNEGNVTLFLFSAPSDAGMDLVYGNQSELQELGLYEEALLDAFRSCRVNHHHIPIAVMTELFQDARMERLRSLAPLPGPGPFTLYRGVSGRGRSRRIRGLSWTDDPQMALWFARRLYLADPAVYTVTAASSDVYAYLDDRGEREYVVLLPATERPRRVEVAEDAEWLARRAASRGGGQG